MIQGKRVLTKRRWVWHSTDESIAQGHISVLALIEIPIAILFFGMIAYYSHWPWLSVLGMLAAPLLLLRSEASIADGIRRIKMFLDTQKSAIPQWYIWVITLGVIAGGTIAVFAPSGEVFLAYLFYLFLIASVTSCFWGMQDDRASRVLAVIFSIPIALLLAEWVKSVSNARGHPLVMTAFLVAVTPRIAIPVRSLLTSFEASVGIFYRTVAIRIVSTLRHLLLGLHALPKNWRENVCIVDFFKEPELLPGARRADPRITKDGMLILPPNRQSYRQLTKILVSIIFYIPAILYRWNLKSSAWLWWPVALFFTNPTQGQSDQDKREMVGVASSGPIAKLRKALMFTGLAWLIIRFIPADLIAPMNAIHPLDEVKAIADKIPAPPIASVRYWLLMICVLSAIILYWLTAEHEARGKKPEESPDNTAAIERHERRVQWIGRLRLWTLAAFILTVWVSGLWFVEVVMRRKGVHSCGIGCDPICRINSGTV